MPGVHRYPIDKLLAHAERCAELGIPAVLLFGIPGTKDEQGSSGWADDGVVQQATRALKRWLEERFLPETNLDVGVRSSLGTGAGYAGVILAVLIALVGVPWAAVEVVGP